MILVFSSLSVPALASDSSGNLEYLSEYGATIGPEDRASSTGNTLSQPGAILQQDRFNVNVRGIIQPGDSTDDYFADKASRSEIARAVIEFSDSDARSHLLNGTHPLLVVAHRRRNDDKLVLTVSTSDGAPADDPEADAGDISLTNGELPTPFQGRWATSAKACTSGNRMEMLTIDARRIYQAEGEMRVVGVSQDSNDRSRITFEAQNMGGGDEWYSNEEFSLSRDGMVIAWRQLSPAASGATEFFYCDE